MQEMRIRYPLPCLKRRERPRLDAPSRNGSPYRRRRRRRRWSVHPSDYFQLFIQVLHAPNPENPTPT